MVVLVLLSHVLTILSAVAAVAAAVASFSVAAVAVASFQARIPCNRVTTMQLNE